MQYNKTLKTAEANDICSIVAKPQILYKHLIYVEKIKITNK